MPPEPDEDETEEEDADNSDAPLAHVSDSPAKKKIGRKTDLTPDVIDEITKVVRNGNYIETAAAFAGVHKDTLYLWLKKGANATDEECAADPVMALYRQFSDDLAIALAEAEIRANLAVGRAANEGDWRAAAWRLSRMHRERWGEPVRETAASVTMPAADGDGEVTFTLRIADTTAAQGVEEEEIHAGIERD